tara:strand:+ start:267 stop:1706 length:1440 start_codon:yes stop_codon:yes gene_type:complete
MVLKTRFAPSPTGDLHLGGVRTALYNWALARRNNGKFALRIENTDMERSAAEYTEGILNGLQWLNIDFDEGPVFQTDRLPRYREVADTLLSEGNAYFCSCSQHSLDKMRREQIEKGLKPRYNGKCRPLGRVEKNTSKDLDGTRVIRFMSPLKGSVSWKDLVKGEITISNEELDDLVLIRANGLPTYNFASVVDDLDMDITHIIRGDDHVNNTPRQINIIQSLGNRLPFFGHLPMIHGPDGQKLSKRHGADSILEFRKKGFIPSAMINYLARLGWSHGDRELFSVDEFVSLFSLSGCVASPAKFDMTKLAWVNGEHLKNLSGADVAQKVCEKRNLSQVEIKKNGIEFEGLCGLLLERANTISELSDELYSYISKPKSISLRELFESPAYRKNRVDSEQILYEVVCDFVKNLPHDWVLEKVSHHFRSILATRNLKTPQLAIPLRIIVLGQYQSPAIEKVLFLLGRMEVEKRLKKFLEGTVT